jgi:CRP-like cAMP-binding protein
MALQQAQIVSHLRSTLPLQDLSNDELQALAARVREHRYSANEVIYRQGAPPSALYIITSGQVRESAKDEAGREVFRTIFTRRDARCFAQSSAPGITSVATR